MTLTRATSQATGVSRGDLKAQGIKGSDIQQYISETEMDANQSKAFYARMQKIRTQQLTTSTRTAAEAEKLAKTEIQERQKLLHRCEKPEDCLQEEVFLIDLKA